MTNEEKAYKEALERARAILQGEYKPEIAAKLSEALQGIFPELKESEDERVRKAILELIKQSSEILEKKNQKRMIAWLEKQCGQKNKINSCKFTFEDVLALECAMKTAKITKGCEELYKILAPLYDKVHNAYLAEIPNKQKPTDAVKPKFKVGDWVVQEKVGVYKVIEVCESWYEVVDNRDKHYSIGFDKEWMCHRWTIQDAKDGDVLAEKCAVLMFRGIGNVKWDDVIDYHCYYDYYRKNFTLQEDLDYWGHINDNQLKPATRGQRDLLFKKMKEAGYEWHADTKELKGLEAV